MKFKLRYFKTPAWDLLEIARLWFCLWLIHTRLAVLPHNRNRHLLTPTPESLTQSENGPLLPGGMQRALRYFSLVKKAAALHSPRVSCLRRSLCLHKLFRRKGLKSVVQFGARKSPSGGLEAHAWVEAGDRIWDTYLPAPVPLSESPFSRFRTPTHLPGR
jgi:hypothetical protein